MRLYRFIDQFPLPAASLALGLSGLIALWYSQVALFAVPYFIVSAFSFLIVFILLLKYFRKPKAYFEAIRHPAQAGSMATLSMALMVISIAVGYLYYPLRVGLWYFALGLHVLTLSSFVYYRLKKWDFKEMLPSWFVPPVGIASGALTLPGAGTDHIAYFFLIFAMLSLVVLAPLMQFRLLFGKPISESDRSSFAVLAAPPNLCLAAYLTISDDPRTWLVFGLLSYGLFMTATVYMAHYVLLRRPFDLSLAALTFPAAIGATAIEKTIDKISTFHLNGYVTHFLEGIRYIEIALASVTILYILYGYLKYFRQFILDIKANKT